MAPEAKEYIEEVIDQAEAARDGAVLSTCILTTLLIAAKNGSALEKKYAKKFLSEAHERRSSQLETERFHRLMSGIS